jgi:anti-sigma B factor antagonist
MQLDVRDDGRVTIISIDGDLIIGEPEAAFKKAVTRLLEDGKVLLLIDCAKARMVDSSGLGAIVRAFTMSQAEGGQAKLLGVQPRLKKLLSLTGLGNVLEMHESLEEAVASF